MTANLAAAAPQVGDAAALICLSAPLPVLSPWLARPLCVQALRVRCGSIRTMFAALDGLGRGRLAGRGRDQSCRPVACTLLWHALMHSPHRAVTLSLSLRFCACYCGEQAAFDRTHSCVRHFGRVLTLPYKSTWATRCSSALLSYAGSSEGSRRSALTDDYQSEVRHHAQLRRRRR